MATRIGGDDAAGCSVDFRWLLGSRGTEYIRLRFVWWMPSKRWQKWHVVAGTEVVRQENSKVAKHVPVLSMVDHIYNALTPKGVTMKVFGNSKTVI